MIIKAYKPMEQLISVKLSRLIEAAKSGNIEEASQIASLLKQSHLKSAAKRLVDKIINIYGLDISTDTQNAKEATYLSEIDDQTIKQGISIVSCCMNRNDNLKRAVLTWLNLKADEIIIVDWSSSIPVSETLSDINDNRVKIIRVEGEDKWILTKAFNVGLRFARYSKIYKFDADIEVKPNFIEINPFTENQYVRGNWAFAVENGSEHQKFVNGSFAAPKNTLKNIGYYNEYIQTYGWDDSDIYQRLSLIGGLNAKFIDPDSLFHMEQAKEERLKYQSVNQHLFLDKFESTEYYNMRNKYLTALQDDWQSELLADYKIIKNRNCEWYATRVTETISLPYPLQQDAEKYAVLKLTSWADGYLYSILKNTPNLAHVLIDHFNRCLPVELTTTVIEIMTSRRDSSDLPIDLQVSEIVLVDNLNTALVAEVEGKKILLQPKLDNILMQNLSGLGKSFNGKSIFITSLFDEKNEERLEEYLYCVTENIKYFDYVVMLYENNTGDFLKRLKLRVNSEILNKKLIVLEYNNRPTFEFIFELSDALFPNGIIHVSNADIVTNETIRKVPDFITEDKFFVLSRNEADAKTKNTQGLILNQLGVANTFSADMWIYKAPRKYIFKSDFGIGTFHCDSFLNYFISESGYELYNPCLSVDIFHIHDPKFNSSETKAKVQKHEIDKRLEQETKLNGGTAPICGSRWSDLISTNFSQINQGRVYWTDAVLIVPTNKANLFSVIILVNHCLEYMRSEGFYYSIWLQISSNDLKTGFLGLLCRVTAAFESDIVNVTVENVNDVNLVETRVSEKIDIDELLSLVTNNSLITDFQALFYNGENRQGTIFLDADMEDYEIYTFLKNTKTELLDRTKQQLERLGEPNFSPHIQDLDRYISSSSSLEELFSFYDKNQPDITYITSIFKGELFMRGFLSNIAAASVESNGHVILLDANSPQNEKDIFDKFINDFPELETYFTYLSLDKDPGLYNCWKLGIEEARSMYVSNANLDDRRSPFHSKYLVAELQANRQYRGAASGMRANTAKNVAYYSVCDDQYWFTEGYEKTITFDSLYFKSEDNLIMSHNIMHCMPVWDKTLHVEYGYFDEERYGTSADWAFWLKCTQSGESFMLLNGVFSQYFINESSHNRVNDADGEKENLIVLDFFGVIQSEFKQQ